jgi:signal peptidase I
MSATLIAIVVFGASTVALLLLAAALLKLGARWAKAPDIGYGRAVVTVLLISGAGLAVSGVFLLGRDLLPQDSYAALAIEFALQLIASWIIVRWMLRTSFGKAILAWLPTLLANGAALVWTLAVIRPFLFEAFTVPTNSMAPTILGDHRRTTCPSCGAVGYVSASDVPQGASGEELGICGGCLRASRMAARDETRHRGDRLLVCKLLHPRRWDIVVFRYPEDPSINYVMRVVGLPGEEVAIRDHDVWINGSRARKPADISGLEYVADPLSAEVTEWGPVELGRDECFVLGDFSRRAKDSRLWQSGAPGHPPYAVPMSNVQGVVTHIYWPPSRWRILR